MIRLLSVLALTLVWLQAYAQSDNRSLTSSFQVTSDEPSQEYIFGKVKKEERFAFIIDTSMSFHFFQKQVITSLTKTISELKENQSFTIVYLAKRNRYFNDGKTVKATQQNRDAAVQFLIDVPEPDRFEPLNAAVKKIAQENGVIERIFLFGDGDITPRHGSRDGVLSADEPAFLELLETLREYPVPFTSRSGFGSNSYEKLGLKSLSEILDAQFSLLKHLTELNGGTLILEGLEFKF